MNKIDYFNFKTTNSKDKKLFSILFIFKNLVEVFNVYGFE